MRVAVISDTHDVLREEVVEQIRRADAVIHVGDVSKPQIIDRIKAEMADNARLYLVRGNADGEWAKDIPETLELELEGLRIFVVHNRKKAAIPEHSDIVIFGHTHKYLMETPPPSGRRQDASPMEVRCAKGEAMETETIAVSGNQATLHSKNEKREISQGVNGARLWLNPGACGRQRFRSELSMAVLVLDDGRWQVEKIVMEPKGKNTASKDQASSVETPPPFGRRISRPKDEDATRRGQDAPSMERNAAHLDGANGAFGSEPRGDSTGRKSYKNLMELSSGELLDIITGILGRMRRGKAISQIAAELNLEESFVEEICRIYVTHPGVTAGGILDKLEVNRHIGA